MSQKAVYTHKDILVTNVLIAVGNKTYNINNILSVEYHVKASKWYVRLLVFIVSLYISFRLGIVAAYILSPQLGAVSILACIGIVFLLLHGLAKRFLKTRYELVFNESAKSSFRHFLKSKSDLDITFAAISNAIDDKNRYIMGCARCNLLARSGASFCARCGAALTSMKNHSLEQKRNHSANVDGKTIVKEGATGILGLVVDIVAFLPRLVASILGGISRI